MLDIQVYFEIVGDLLIQKLKSHMIYLCSVVLLERLRQLITKHLEKEYHSLSNSLWIVLELSTTMAAMVAFLPKPLNTSNPTAASTRRKLILTPVKMEPASIQLKTSVYKSLTQSTLLW